MAYRVAVDSIGSGTRFDLGTADSMFVPKTVSVISDDTFGIVFSGVGQSVRVFGLVAASSNAIASGNPDMSVIADTSIFIGATGIVDAYFAAIQLRGSSNSLVNYGAISSRTSGIDLSNTNTFQAAAITNYGSISGDFAISGASNGTVRVVNYGTLQGGAAAINTLYGAGAGADVIINRGQIEGAIYLGDGADKLTNRGLIAGIGVDMGTGADVLDNRGGTIDGQINFGNGADTFMPGASEEAANGGSDQGDRLDFTKSSGVRLALDGSFVATGWAAGDDYTGFTDILGSSTAGDVLTGNAAINYLYGFGGNDVLSGVAGADRLEGGAGNDTLDGGNDNDNLFGGADNDTLLGGAGTDFLSGGAGNDRLRGGLGSDVLEGGTGADTFVFARGEFGGTAQGTREQINDFKSAEQDKLDLSAVDASTKVAGDQAFTFIGSAAFHNLAGELRFMVVGSFVVVQADTNGDGVVDLAFDVNGLSSLAASDFIL